MILKFLILRAINPAAHTAITIYIQAWNKPRFFILSLSPEAKAFIQLDKLNPAEGITAPAKKDATDGIRQKTWVKRCRAYVDSSQIAS